MDKNRKQAISALCTGSVSAAFLKVTVMKSVVLSLYLQLGNVNGYESMFVRNFGLTLKKKMAAIANGIITLKHPLTLYQRYFWC